MQLLWQAAKIDKTRCKADHEDTVFRAGVKRDQLLLGHALFGRQALEVQRGLAPVIDRDVPAPRRTRGLFGGREPFRDHLLDTISGRHQRIIKDQQGPVGRHRLFKSIKGMVPQRISDADHRLVGFLIDSVTKGNGNRPFPQWEKQGTSVNALTPKWFL